MAQVYWEIYFVFILHLKFHAEKGLNPLQGDMKKRKVFQITTPMSKILMSILWTL